VKVPYTSAELRKTIKDVLSNPQPGDRRVALVAFVGGQAEAFLPDPEGLEIVCWFQPGSTSARARSPMGVAIAGGPLSQRAVDDAD
jgi:hypothetical protein